ncbi:MAG TPA: hypothetical protein VFT59_00275 [Candidatus Saccharimonadales bacterium]|nr:hypothetical protein [Candidatus Saccharimonadales bacterium]
MKVSESCSRLTRPEPEHREIKSSADELLVYFVDVLAKYSSGTVRVSSYHRGRFFRAEFSSAGDRYSWFVESSEDSIGLSRLFLLFCYYNGLQEKPDRSEEFQRWSKQAHSDLGLTVATPLNVGGLGHIRRVLRWGLLKTALLHAIDIGFNDAYDAYSSQSLAEAWGLHQLDTAISFDEVLTA